jgi:hypothetical protein
MASSDMVGSDCVSLTAEMTMLLNPTASSKNNKSSFSSQ